MSAPKKPGKASVLVSISDFLKEVMNRPGVNTKRMAEDMDIARNQLYRIRDKKGVNVETAERVLAYFGKKLAIVDIESPKKTSKKKKKSAVKKKTKKKRKK